MAVGHGVRAERRLACAHEANKGRSTSYVRDEKVGCALLRPHAPGARTVRPPSALKFP